MNNKQNMFKKIKKIFLSASFTRVVAAGYLLFAVMGTFLLMLPVSSKSGDWTSFTDALTTATSASCVTGLIVYDTFTHWSLFGQIVILCLIQVGGLGYMLFITMFSLLIDRKIGLRERGLLKESTNSLNIGGLMGLVKKAVIGTLIFESAGAVILAWRFSCVFGIKKGIYYGIFHSVSSFCNAGFDLMGALEPYSSMTHFKSDPIVLITLSTLIVIGGLGFVVWADVCKNKLDFKKYSLHTKIVFATSVILLVSGAILTFALEYDATLAGMSFFDKLINSLFTSASARTAGFNSVELSKSTPSTYLWHILFMLIGGSPGSTAGGLKTTTFAVIILTAWATVRNSKNVNAFGRKLDSEVIRKSLTVVMIYLSFMFISTLIICASNPTLTLPAVLFETASAVGTVGLSVGVMGSVNTSGQMILTLLMFCGRVGSMSFAMVFAQRKTESKIIYPTEKITVG